MGKLWLRGECWRRWAGSEVDLVGRLRECLRYDAVLWLSGAVAGVLSQIVDTFIFIAVAFYGQFPIGELLVGQMIAKVVLSALLVPPLIYAGVAIGRALDRV